MSTDQSAGLEACAVVLHAEWDEHDTDISLQNLTSARPARKEHQDVKKPFYCSGEDYV